MKIVWQRFTATLTPGVRMILIVLTITFLATLAGKLTHTVDLPRWLAASSPASGMARFGALSPTPCCQPVS
jgi:hypothetical protein